MTKHLINTINTASQPIERSGTDSHRLVDDAGRCPRNNGYTFVNNIYLYVTSRSATFVNKSIYLEIYKTKADAVNNSYKRQPIHDKD